MDSMRVSVNLLGNCVATFVVANWEGQLDRERMTAVLNGEDAAPVADPASDADDGAEREAMVHAPRD
jgi:aerobic C4-dicarboxylate transport protein